MYTLFARNVNDAYRQGAALLRQKGKRLPSRGGTVLEAPQPVCTQFQRPTERVLFDPERDANPFFHFFESLWMLAGRNDVAFPAQFAPRMLAYSDNGLTLHAAYGFRWREHFGADQLDRLVTVFQKDPNTRRAYLAMWAPANDLDVDSKDLPCNVGVKFEQRDGLLNMVVFNRSNDMIWGAYGANVVHMSYLQEYLAGRCGFGVGWYEQVSTNFHAYEEIWQKLNLDQHVWDGDHYHDPYTDLRVRPFPLMLAPDLFDAELRIFLASPLTVMPYINPIFSHVARPLYAAFDCWRASKHKAQALSHLDECEADDWALAAREWLLRRKVKEVTVG